jgi:hypothetical protein
MSINHRFGPKTIFANNFVSMLRKIFWKYSEIKATFIATNITIMFDTVFVFLSMKNPSIYLSKITISILHIPYCLAEAELMPC